MYKLINKDLIKKIKIHNFINDFYLYPICERYHRCLSGDGSSLISLLVEHVY